MRGLSPEKVVAYCSAQLTPGGDWGNFVLFRAATPHEGIAGFRSKNPAHVRAVRDISPAYYRSVRITALELWSEEDRSGSQCSFKFKPVRTLQVEYPPIKLGGRPVRQVHYWVDGVEHLF